VANLGLARTGGWNRSGFFYRCDETFCFKWKRVHVRLFHRKVFQTQHASFSGRCGGHSAVGEGDGTQKNISACAHERQDNRMATSLRMLFQASAQIMDLDFKIFDSERLLTEVKKRVALCI
jgi:hypothetical protein